MATGCARPRSAEAPFSNGLLPSVAGPAAPGEPSVHPERYALSIAALGMPGAQRALQVGPGSMVGNGDAALEWRIPSAAGPVRISPIAFERDGVPIAHWWMVTARESVHFEAAAVRRPALGDTSLMLSVRATATWLAAEPGESALEVRVLARPNQASFVPWDAEDAVDYREFWDDRYAVRNDRVVAGVDREMTRAPDAPQRSRPGTTHGPGPGTLASIGRARLSRGERHAWHFWMPAYPSAAGGAALERLAGHDAVAGEARATWRRWLALGSPLEIPDPRTDAAWRAALVTLLACQERAGDGWAAIGNPFQYRDVWLRDAARTVRALAVAGYTDLARSDAWTLTRFQFPNGVLLSQRGQLDGTGEGLWALAQAATLPPSAEWAARAVPCAARALQWIELQRAITRQLGTRFAGLLPYGEPRDNELTRAQLVGNDAWSIAGCRAVATLARLAGADSLARAADATEADYRAAFRRAFARTPSTDVPPSWQGPGRDWGNLAVGYPTRVLPESEPRLSALARRVWGRRGPGLVSSGPIDTLHTYVGTDLAQWALLAGRPSEARAYLADLLDHSSSTLGQAEAFDRADMGYGFNLPPHTTAAACLIDLVRNMVVCDVRDTLELALGADSSWWTGTRFARAPTRFGVIDVRLERPGADRLRASWSAVAVPARVRVPDGVRAVEVLTAGARAVTDRWIECPAGATTAEFRIAPTAAGGAR